ncbi:hypothetical protein [Arthrobacter bambusae]|uniref:hypothetical protein n=1 Tax=Arthrobacter bambusae TaxID=1338426 RepID=UPI0027850121|nr:hypothetical protein [Arthrobacter bambusae]MDQ0028462.1 hypothetical protein [Arthrobacter bambusae]MDQ0096743.1 hypothetical protein [Arthrobacter bambusae]
MTLNETIARLRAGHLMVRDAREWDELSTDLGRAYDSNDDELIEQLQPQFLQSWRTVTRYVLRDTFDAAGIAVTDPSHPWGIATLTANGTSCEPLLCHPDAAGTDGLALATSGGLQLRNFADTMTDYTDCLALLFDGVD